MPKTSPFLMAIAIVTFIFLLGPLIIVLGTALNDRSVLAFPPTGFSLEWFEKALTMGAFQRAFMTSVQVSVAGTCFALLLGIPAAYALNRHAVRLPKSLSVLFVLPVLVPEIVFGFSLLANVQVGFDLPLVPTLVIGHTLLVLPYTVRVVSASLASFDFSAEEAAISLGSPPLKTFFTVVLPNIRSGIIAAFTLAFITSLNDVSISVFLTGPGISTLPIQILTYVEQFFDPTVAAVSVLMMILTAAVMVAVERTLGLTFFSK